LRVPTIRKNPDAGSDDEDEDEDESLIRYVVTIDKLISQSLRSTKKELENIKTYMQIFEKRTDTIITDLKIKSFEKAQNISEDGDKQGKGSDEQSMEQSSEDEDESISQDSDDEEDEEGGGGRAGNELAYKSQEIDDDLLRDELFSLRDLVWRVLGNIHN
jgi:hypothetical protein